jgi:hypothetical protein
MTSKTKFAVGLSIIALYTIAAVFKSDKKRKDHFVQHNIYGKYYLQNKAGDACDNCYIILAPNEYRFAQQGGTVEAQLSNTLYEGWFSQIVLNKIILFQFLDGSTSRVIVNTDDDDWILQIGQAAYKHEVKY